MTAAGTDSSPARRFMWIWLGTIVAVVAVVFPAVTFILLNWFDAPTGRWVHQLRLRKFHATELASGQRLLIAGGSSGHFSVDAEWLQAELGMPVVNLATHAGYGLRFLLADARHAARRGDFVLLHLEESEYAFKNIRMSDLERKFIWTYEPWTIFRLPFSEALAQIYGNPLADYQASWERWNQRLRPATEGPLWEGYSYVALSPEGDYRGGVPQGRKLTDQNTQELSQVNRASAEMLQQFFAWCKKRDIRVIGTLPLCLRPSVEDHATAAVQKFFEKNGLPLIGKGDARHVPRELLFDTIFHANAVGQRIWSAQLAGELAPSLRKNLSESKTIFLLSSPGEIIKRDVLLPEIGSVTWRYLNAEDLHHPWCLTPADCKSLAEKGTDMVFADAGTGKLLADAGLGSKIVRRQMTTLHEWIDAYPEHLFALAAVGDVDVASWGDDLPEPFRRFCQTCTSNGVALIGTGKFKSMCEINGAGKSPALRILSTTYQRQTKKLPLEIALHAGPPTDPKQPPIAIDQHPFGSPDQAGLQVVVIDPELGIVVRHALFETKEMLDFELRRIEAR